MDQDEVDRLRDHYDTTDVADQFADARDMSLPPPIDEEHGRVEIRVGLPLPLDIAAGIMRGIAGVFPSARVSDNSTDGWMLFYVDRKDLYRD